MEPVDGRTNIGVTRIWNQYVVVLPLK